MVRRSCVTWITKTLKMYKPISYRKRYTHDIMTVSWRHTHLAAQVWRQISSQHGGCMRWFGRRCAVGLRCTWCSPELRHHWRASTRCRPHSPSPGRSPPTSWKMRWRQRRDLKVGRDDKGVFTSWGGNLFWAPMCGGCGSRDAMVRTVCCPWSNLAILSFTFCSKSKKIQCTESENSYVMDNDVTKFRQQWWLHNWLKARSRCANAADVTYNKWWAKSRETTQDLARSCRQ